MNAKDELLYLDIGGIDNNTNRIQNHKSYTWNDAPSRAQQKVFVNDILFSTVRTYMRNIAVVDKRIYDGQIASSGFCVIRAKSEVLDHKYAFYYTLTQTFLQPLNELQTGSSYPAVRDSDVFAQQIPIPPLAEQHEIVSKIEELLSDLENGKQQLLTAREQLKVYRQSLLKWAFEGKLTENWRKQNLSAAEGSNSSNAQKGSKGKSTPKVHGSRVRIPTESHSMAAEPEVGYVPKEGTELGELPEGWNFKKLGEITTVLGDGLHGTPKYSEIGEYYFINGNNLNEGKIEIKENTKRVTLEEFNKYKKPLSERTVLISINGSIGYTAFYNNEKIVLGKSACYFNLLDTVDKNYIRYYLTSNQFISYANKNATGSTIKNVGLKTMRELEIPLSSSLEEQQAIVEELESKLTVCDKIEEAIESSLQQAETLKQSILKQAFEGRLVAAEEKPAYKPKNVYFYQMQLLGYVLKISKEKNISHGEMTTAKYMYLIDRLFKVPTHYKYERWHLGPYPPEMKKAVKNKKFFGADGNELKVVDEKSLFKYNNPYEQQVIDGIGELAQLFGQYVPKERPHQTELLATVCKVIEDIQSTDLAAVRQSMKEWKIDLKNTKVKNKAEKFNEDETRECLNLITKNKWQERLIT